MDAPAHVIRRGATIDAMPLDAGMGTARVIGIRDPVSVTVRELRPHRIRRGERILFKTRNSLHSRSTGRFRKDFVYISAEAAGYLAERKVRLVGVDYLSVGGFKKDGVATHQALLGAGIWIVEGLNLSMLTPGPVDMICLPLRLLNADGAPARAIVRMKRR
jgi:arylformamidase